MFASYFLNRLLDVFEVISNESFWINLLGERLLFILKRYAGNDTILVCVFLTLIPGISQVTKAFYDYCKRIKEEMFYVSVVIGDNELIFTPVDEYVTKHFHGIDTLRHVRGKTGYADPADQVQKSSYYSYYRRHQQNDQDNTPLIDLIPKNTDEAPSSDNVRSPFLSMASMRTDTIEIKMRSRDLPKLRSFIQDWLIIYKCNFNNHGWDDDNQWKEHGYRKIRSFNSVVLKKGEQERILNDILTFKESKEWYNDRGIPYRRGYLLHGPPGTGKTSFIQSLASKVKMNVAILNLSAASNDDSLSSAMAQLPKSCILVIEDVDHYQFDEGLQEKKDDSKANKKNSSSVSVSGILNAIDGIASLEESIIFMTCNDMNTIPPALIRPGRIDLKLHMGYIDDYQAKLIFWRFFCMEEKETALEDIPTENTPYSLLQETAHQVSKKKNISLEISPAELISYLLFHALKFKLSKQPQHLDLCCQSILDHIPELIESVATDRKQAIEHAKKKALLQQQEQQQNDASSSSSTADSTTTSEARIPTPPTSPSVEKKTIATNTGDTDSDHGNEEQQQAQDTSS
ncbi:P-loop containing nucleoside triphosphate hydrolase protein [Mucor lusitanicus]